MKVEKVDLPVSEPDVSLLLLPLASFVPQRLKYEQCSLVLVRFFIFLSLF